MNYILEGNKKFNEILMEAVCASEEKSKKCLISHKKLNADFVTLKCKHQFNYDEILKEVYQQKKT